MSKPDDGGSAFPQPIDSFEKYENNRGGTSIIASEDATHAGGMSLRDWFAGHSIDSAARDSATADAVAKRAYAIADAMIAARKENT